MLRRIVFTFLIVFGSAECRAQISILDRQPAVAGTFYPADKNELIDTLADLFTHAVPSKNITDVVAIIAPHAGYIFSGSVAASSFNQIDPEKEYDNIFVIGSSHYVSFDGASIYRKGNFITPLGTVKVNTKLAGDLIAKNPFFSDRDDAHAKEHCIEAELPFLQYRMKKAFRIVPIVIGTQSPDVCRQIADALRPYCTPKNLFIISTDFSHYPAYDDAVKVDTKTAAAVCTNSADKFISVLRNNAGDNIPDLATSMCGWTSVLTFLYIVQGNPAFTFEDIQYKNSGDVLSGDKKRVVGYHAIAISRKNDQAAESFHLTDADKKNLLTLARRTVESYVTQHGIPDVNEDSISKNLLVKCGAFVTLNKNGNLRGCIGRFDATEPLYKVVRSMAIAAATQDVRFSAVEPGGVSHLKIEISVLTPMRKISSIDEFDPGKEGIYMKKGMHAGTFLPQVAKETGWSKEELLGHCAQDKAGIGWDGWKDADLYIYEALVFGEER